MHEPIDLDRLFEAGDDPEKIVRAVGLTPEEIESFMKEHDLEDDPDVRSLLEASRKYYGRETNET